MKVLVTGASGFVGTTLCADLQARGHEVTAAVRRTGSAPSGTSEILVGDINPSTDWAPALRGQDAVVHLAARVHVMVETSDNPMAEFRRINTEGTLMLAQAAQRAGISKFVFLSSIKANGESTTTKPFTVNDSPHPLDPYGISKLEAEQGIECLAEHGATDFAVVRTPLVYGPGVGGNFLRLIQLVDRRLPIPLAGVRNTRAMVSVWNLSDLIVYLLGTKSPPSQLVLICDRERLSTPALIRAIGHGLGKPPRLFWLPVSLLKFVGRFVGKGAEANRLIGSLDVEAGSTSQDYSWEPPISAQDGIDRTAKAWRDTTQHVEVNKL